MYILQGVYWKWNFNIANDGVTNKESLRREIWGMKRMTNVIELEEVKKHWLNICEAHELIWKYSLQNVLNISGFNLRSSNLYDSIVYS